MINYCNLSTCQITTNLAISLLENDKKLWNMGDQEIIFDFTYRAFHCISLGFFTPNHSDYVSLTVQIVSQNKWKTKFNTNIHTYSILHSRGNWINWPKIPYFVFECRVESITELKLQCRIYCHMNWNKYRISKIWK